MKWEVLQAVWSVYILSTHRALGTFVKMGTCWVKHKQLSYAWPQYIYYLIFQGNMFMKSCSRRYFEKISRDEVKCQGALACFLLQRAFQPASRQVLSTLHCTSEFWKDLDLPGFLPALLAALRIFILAWGHSNQPDTNTRRSQLPEIAFFNGTLFFFFLNLMFNYLLPLYHSGFLQDSGGRLGRESSFAGFL